MKFVVAFHEECGLIYDVEAYGLHLGYTFTPLF